MPAQKFSVNLLPPSEFELSFWGRFLKWAVTTGRYIIILTELVVILAFLSRFKLDEDLRNVNEQIQTQVSFLESQQPQLNDFLALQKRMQLIDKFWGARTDVTGMMDYMIERTPPEVKITLLSVTGNEVTVGATTLSESALGQMMTSLSQDKMWKSLDLTQVVSDEENGIKFTLTATK